MRRHVLGVAVLGLVIGITTNAWTRGTELQTGKGVFAGLKVGQPVTLKDVGVAYEVSLMDQPFPTGLEVAEVGLDFLVIKSQVGIETRIPVTSIKAIVRIPTR